MNRHNMTPEERRAWVQSLTPEEFATHLEDEAGMLEGEAPFLESIGEEWLARQCLAGADDARAEALLVRTFPKPSHHNQTPS